MKKLFSILLILLGFSSGFAENIQSIQVVCEEWNQYTNKDGTGAYWEIIKAVYEPVGIKVKTTVIPWRRAKYTITKKLADALVGDYFNPHGTDFIYPKWHLSVEDPVVAYFKKGKMKEWESKGIQSLAEKKVMWIKGYDFDKIFLGNIPIKKFDTISTYQGMRMIEFERVNVLLDYESHIRHNAKKLKIDVDRDYEIKTAKLGNKLFVVFANTLRSRKLVKIFDQRMTTLAHERKIEDIYMKWGLGAKKFGKDRYNKD